MQRVNRALSPLRGHRAHSKREMASPASGGRSLRNSLQKVCFFGQSGIRVSALLWGPPGGPVIGNEGVAQHETSIARVSVTNSARFRKIVLPSIGNRDHRGRDALGALGELWSHSPGDNGRIEAVMSRDAPDA